MLLFLLISLYLSLLCASVQCLLQLVDDGISLSQDAALPLLTLLLLPLDVPPGITHLLQLQSLTPQQYFQALIQTQTFQ